MTPFSRWRGRGITNFHRLEERSSVPCPCCTNCIIKAKTSSFTLVITARVTWRPDTIVQFVTYVLDYLADIFASFHNFHVYCNSILLQDFDLCVSCKEKDGHPHPMEKLGFDLDDGSSPADAKQTNPQVTFRFILKISVL